MSGSIASADKCEPNLVPILDMVFQLITFFMLVVNFKATEVDLNLNLPVIGSAQPVTEDETRRELMVVNIRKNGDVAIRGKVQPDVNLFLRLEASALSAMHSIPQGNPLPVTVVVRADKGIRVQALMEVVNSCRANGFDKFDFVIIRGTGKT